MEGDKLEFLRDLEEGELKMVLALGLGLDLGEPQLKEEKEGALKELIGLDGR